MACASRGAFPEREDVFEDILHPGVHWLWDGALFERADITAVLAARGAPALLEAVEVEAGHAVLLFVNGRHEATLAPGVYGLWRGVARAKVVIVELREQVLDVTGQEIMTADKVNQGERRPRSVRPRLLPRAWSTRLIWKTADPIQPRGSAIAEASAARRSNHNLSRTDLSWQTWGPRLS